MGESGYDKAMSYALRLLGFRMRTEKELRERLERKGYDPGVTLQVVDRLKQWGYLDDQVYVENYIRSKIKPSGRSLLKHELQLKGVEKDLVDAGLEKFFSIEQELQAAEELALKLWRMALRTKAGSMGDPQEIKQKYLQRTAAKLLARGFSYNTVKTVLTKLEPEFNNHW